MGYQGLNQKFSQRGAKLDIKILTGKNTLGGTTTTPLSIGTNFKFPGGKIKIKRANAPPLAECFPFVIE